MYCSCAGYKCRKNEDVVQATYPETLDTSTGEFLLYFQFNILAVLWQSFPEVFRQELFDHCSQNFLWKTQLFLPEQKRTFSFCNATLNTTRLSVFLRSLAPSRLTDTSSRLIPACGGFKPFTALSAALFCNSYSHYTTVMKKVFLSFAHHCVFCCTGLKFSGRSVREKLHFYVTAATYLAPSVTSVLISSQGHHYLCNLYPSVTLGWNGLRIIKNYLGIRRWQKSGEKGQTHVDHLTFFIL